MSFPKDLRTRTRREKKTFSRNYSTLATRKEKLGYSINPVELTNYQNNGLHTMKRTLLVGSMMLIYDVKSWTKCSSRRVVTSTCHLVASTVISSCRLVVPPSHLVESTCHLLASACRLVVSPFQLVVSPPQLVISSLITVLAAILNIENTLRKKRQTMHKLKYPHGEFSSKIDELNAVKDLLRHPVSRVDQIPPQNSQTQNPQIKSTNCLLLRTIQVLFNFYLFIYLFTYLFIYIHTYIHTYMHACMHNPTKSPFVDEIVVLFTF